MRNLKLSALAVLASLVTAGSASAQAIDTTAVVTSLEAIGPAQVAVGGTLIGLAATAIGFKWIKGMIFG